MREYLGALFGVCVVSAIVKAVSPEGAAKKYIEILCALCVVCATAAPIARGSVSVDGLDGLFDGDNIADRGYYEEIYGSYIAQGQISVAEEILGVELERLLGEESGTLAVELETKEENDTLTLTGAAVRISREAVDADPEVIKKHLLERLGVECEIIYDF